MSYSPSPADFAAVRAKIHEGVRVQIRAEVLAQAMYLSVAEDGIMGSVEAACALERGPIVTQVLREVADELDAARTPRP